MKPHRPTREQIKAIKASYKNVKGVDKHDLMVKNLAKYNLLNERMNATDIAYSHRKNFGGVGKVDGINPRFTGHYNRKGFHTDDNGHKNYLNRDASRYGQGNYGRAFPKGDHRIGRDGREDNLYDYEQRRKRFGGSSA